jgi:hypothetical protein
VQRLARLRFFLLAILPLLLVGPSLAPGNRFLPILPVAFEPLASENPEAAEEAREGANLVATDRLFPVLTDELEIRSQLLAGELPTWNPGLGLGVPLAAGSMAAPWNPLRWPFLLLPPAIAGGWHALLSLFLAGLGMLFFLERRGLGAAAALFGAIAYQVGGFGIANLHYVMKVDAALWLPWCLWAIDGIFTGKRFAPLFLFAALASSALAGFPPIFVFVVLLAASWFVVRAWSARREGELGIGRPVAKGLLFGALGILAGGVHLLPMIEASAESTRTAQSVERVAAQSLPPPALGTALIPDLFGDAQDPRPASSDPVVWWLTSKGDRERALSANRLEWSFFAGVSVIALAFGALFGATRKARFPAVSLAVVAVFIAGDPLSRLFYALPGLDLGAPARAGTLWWFLLPWLAAIGLDAILEGRRTARRAAISAACLLMAVGVWTLWSIEPRSWAEALEVTLTGRHGVEVETIRSFFSLDDADWCAQRLLAGAVTLTICAGICLLILGFPRRFPRGIPAIGWILLIAGEGVLAALPSVAPARLGEDRLFPDSPTLEAVREATGDGRVLRLDRSETGIGEVLRLARPNLLAAYGIGDLTPYVVFPPRNLVELFAAFDPDSRYRNGVSRISDPEFLDSPLLDRLRVTCILSTTRLDHPRLETRHERDGFIVYRRTGALGPARVVPKLVHGGTDDAAAVVNADFSAEAMAICADAALAEDLSSGPFHEGTIEIVRPSASRVDLIVRDASEGWLVLHDAWDPGWKATVNGRDTAVLRLDHAFRGVRIPAGQTIVRMKYEPLSLRLGAAASLLALFAALFFFWRSLRSHAPADPR